MMREKPFRLGGLAALLAALGLALAACGDRGGAERPPQPGDEAVARVDGKTVWASDEKREAVAQGLIGEGEPLDVTSSLFRRVLDEVVDQKLLAREAERRGLDESPLVQRRLEVTRDRIHTPKGRAGVMREWLRQLAQAGHTTTSGSPVTISW